MKKEDGDEPMKEEQKEIANLKNEISYLNTLLDLSIDSTVMALETNRKLMKELKTIKDRINQR